MESPVHTKEERDDCDPLTVQSFFLIVRVELYPTFLRAIAWGVTFAVARICTSGTVASLFRSPHPRISRRCHGFSRVSICQCLVGLILGTRQ